MKKFNKNSIVFGFVIIFLMCGFIGKFFVDLKSASIEAAVGVKNGNLDSISEFKSNVDKITSEKLGYHDLLMDVNSVKENLLGTRVIRKPDSTIAKTYTDSLISPAEERIDETEMKRMVGEVERLKNYAENSGARFLYFAAPVKEYYTDVIPSNVKSFQRENYLNLIEGLRDADVPLVDMAEVFAAQGKSEESIYFRSDHHWKPETGFGAYKTLCDELNKRYGFEYIADYLSMDNYDLKTYDNFFLGSYGKKTGTFFTWKGADDFDLITPKFETLLTEEQPFKNEKKDGSFEDTVLFKEHLKKDYYGANPYDAYCGGDFRLQIVKNRKNPEGAKVLVVRDSFSQVILPFLSLQTSELHICDVRSDGGYVGEKLNMEKYIREIDPDYVIVMYSGVSALENDTFFEGDK